VLIQTIHTRIHFLLTCLIAFLLPFKQIVSICIALLLLNWILEGDFRNKFSKLRHRNLFVLFVGFYLLHVLGLCWTENKGAGWFDLEVKLSLLIFPFIFATRPFVKEQMDKIFVFFLTGCALAGLIILARAGSIYLLRHENKFFYEEFSWFMHPSYFSMYLNLALLYVLISFSKTEGRPHAVWLLLVPLYVLVIVLLSSKLGLISLLLLILCWLVWMVVNHRWYKIGLLSVIILSVGIAGVLKFSPDISNRLKNAVHALSVKPADKTDAESTAVRMFVWGAAEDVIRTSPWIGVGTGDAKDALMEKYKEESITGALKNHLNAHNAYLQVFVALGLLGFVLLVSMQVFPCVLAVREKKIILLCFILLAVLNFLPEAMLETQAGVMYYGFFNSLLLFSEGNGFQLALPKRNWF
jgi:O-antigen ligase